MNVIDLSEIWSDKEEVSKVALHIAEYLKSMGVHPKLGINAMVHAISTAVKAGIDTGNLPCPDCGEYHTVEQKKERHLKLVKDGPAETN